MSHLHERLAARAIEINMRIGPIAGKDADAIAVQLQQAAHEIKQLHEALKITYSRVPNDKAQDLGFVEAILNHH